MKLYKKLDPSVTHWDDMGKKHWDDNRIHCPPPDLQTFLYLDPSVTHWDDMGKKHCDDMGGKTVG